MKLAPRFLLPLVFLAALALLTALYLGGAEPQLRSFLGAYLVHFDLPPFGDAHGITSAMACERQGIETYLGNPCHYKQVGFVYPPIWKLLSLMPIDGSWTMAFALTFIAAFAAALAFLPLGDGRRGKVLAVLAVLSPASLMAANYGNNDMLIFALVVGAIVALGNSERGRALGYGLIMLAGLLKYFPFAALGWAGAQSRRQAVLVGIVLAAVLIAFVALAGQQLPLSLASMVTMSAGSYVFGIKNLPIMMSEIGLAGPGGALALRLVLTLAVLVGAWRRSARFAKLDLPAAMPEPQWRFLVIGALVVVGAYLGNQNLDYRMIFLLLVLPGLDALRRVPGEHFGAMAVVAVALMYLFPLRMQIEGWFAPGSNGLFLVSVADIMIREALWFALAVTLLALIFTHLRSGPIWQAIGARPAD
ncbi:MAG: glycosyltransferase 87 family protein [Novosphingobium sp.]|uniref:glycosyltransferase 87 family protein n=1 Tax=Novosphingobium sp. TaxID=1874826 RepID=UPI003C7C5217